MAAPTVRQIRQGLADRLDTIDGLRVFSIVPGQFSPPAGIVLPLEMLPTETMIRGTDRWTANVWIVVAPITDAQAEHKLDTYQDPTGATSVRAAVYGDTTLGGVVNDIFLQRVTPSPLDLRDQVWLGLDFEWTILAPGKD